MSSNYFIEINKWHAVFAVIVAVCLWVAPEAKAKELNAGFVLNEMNVDQQVSYIAGVVEGLAYSRYLRDKPDQTGMKCVYDWYAGEKAAKQVDQWFRRHPDKFVGALLHVLIKKECGA